jgi:uncharacterized protein (DUF427 family)
MTREKLIPGPDHPITVTPTGRRVTVKLGDRTVAESTDALTLQEASHPAVQYLPLDDVDPAVLRASDHESYCPFKGEASYYSLVTDEVELTDVVWTYREPYESVAEIKDHVAFYPDRVQITVT